MVDDDTVVSGSELAGLLGVGDRRIQQLAAEGVLERAAHGKYKLGASIRGFIGAIEGRADTDDLRSVRIALMDAQRRRIEGELRDKQANAGQLEAQSGLIAWLGQASLDGYRRIAGDVYAVLVGRQFAAAREVALEVEQWGVAERERLESRLTALEAAARREQTRITDYDTAERLSTGHA